MNRAVLIGRLTADPQVRYSGDNLCIARYTLAVDRNRREEGKQNADFIPCVVMGKGGEFAEKYFRKGMKVAVQGRIQTGSYDRQDGTKVFTTEVILDAQEFVESKNAQGGGQTPAQPAAGSGSDGFMNIPDGIDDGLPFG